MKRLIDITCPAGHERIDVWVDPAEGYPTCQESGCEHTTERLWAMKTAAAVHGDDIPGGMLIYNGLCHEGGAPRRFYSKSEMAKVAKERGLANVVRHITPPGTDKSKHTTRWM